MLEERTVLVLEDTLVLVLEDTPVLVLVLEDTPVPVLALVQEPVRFWRCVLPSFGPLRQMKCASSADSPRS